MSKKCNFSNFDVCLRPLVKYQLRRLDHDGTSITLNTSDLSFAEHATLTILTIFYNLQSHKFACKVQLKKTLTFHKIKKLGMLILIMWPNHNLSKTCKLYNYLYCACESRNGLERHREVLDQSWARLFETVLTRGLRSPFDLPKIENV